MNAGPGAEKWAPLLETLAERIAERAAQILEERWTEGPGRGSSVDSPFGRVGVSPYATVAEAAEVLRGSKQRIYDLLSSRRLTRYRDGRRVLVSRAGLNEYLAAKGSSRVAPTLPRVSQSPMDSGLGG
jgi:excisionase family DNA binding protein